MQLRSGVLAPHVEEDNSVIVTLTPNTGLDRVIFLPRFEWGSTIRATNSTLAMGGKGTDVSVVLAALGHPSLALGFAAGQTGRRMVRMLEEQGVRCDFVWAEEETRTNYVLVDTDRGQQSTITLPGVRVKPGHVAALRAKLREHLPRASSLVLGGSLPQGVEPEIYPDMIADAKEAGVPVLFDASGPGLEAGARALPNLLKLNRAETEQLTDQPLLSGEALHCAAREWVARGVEWVVATAGAQGAWALTASEEYFIPSLTIEPLNTAGAGDGLMAGLAVGLAEDWSWIEALRLGTAAAAAVCLTPGTAQCHQEDVERLVAQVRIIAV